MKKRQGKSANTPRLAIVIPCYNEEEVLPVTSKMFLDELTELIKKKKVASNSSIMFVNDGSKDSTWQIIEELAKSDKHFCGISQSRNRGHQNAVVAGLMEVRDLSYDIAISIDCDGQDDIKAMGKMIDEYLNGCDIVYGVRNSRATDTFFKRSTAHAFYRLMTMLGVETVYDHADYRLVSKRALDAFSEFQEVNLFLRGMFPLVGFKSTSVYYERYERIAGKSHYPLRKMISLAINGITSLSIKPIRIISILGMLVSLISFVMLVWVLITFIMGKSIAGWTSTNVLLCLFSGVQLLSIGVVGEYIGKTYMETKKRPRYIISERTYENANPILENHKNSENLK